MTAWQKYLLDCFKKEEFYNLPERVSSQPAMWRFATYDALVEDTMQRNGPIAAACLSILFKPKIIVEMGVHAGWTTLLLCKLNPQARVHAVDIRGRTDGTDVPICYVPLMHGVPNLSLHIMKSWDFKVPGTIDLCFIDGDHFLPAVERDTWTAWENRNQNGDWCIAWDDYHPNNPDVKNTVDDFCKQVGYPLQKIASWYWIGSKTMSEEEIKRISP